MLDISKLPATPKNLGAALRNRDTWPPGFRWDYTDSWTCAIGLSNQLWGFESAAEMRASLSNDGYNTIFVYQKAGWWLFRSARKVQPEQVADAIDKYLESEHANDNRTGPDQIA